MQSKVYLFALVLFFINPLLGILSYCYFSWNLSMNRNNLQILSWMLAVFLAFINGTKVPVSDLLDYKDAFLYAKDCDFIEYLLMSGKEPIYSTFAYIAYYIFGGNWTFYVWGITLLYYLLINNSIIKVGYRFNCSSSSIIVTLIVCSFFFQIFVMTGHIVRQCLAEAFFIYYLVRRFVEKKSSWWVALLAVGIHSTVLPLVGISLLPQMKRSFNVREIIKSICLIIILVLLFISFESVFSSIPFINYLYARVKSDNLLLADSWQVESGVSILGIVLLIFMIYMIREIKSCMKQSEILNSLINNCSFLIVMLGSFIVLKADYLSMRYFFYVYSYLGVIIVIFLRQKKIYSLSILKVLLVPLFIVYFLYNIESSVFVFEVSVGEILCQPLMLYVVNV